MDQSLTINSFDVVLSCGYYCKKHACCDCFKTPILQGDLEDSKSLLEELCFFEVIHFVPMSCMCKKQTSVSHSSTESEIISLDAGLRLDGIPALDFVASDCFIAVLGNATQSHDWTAKPVVCRDTSHAQVQFRRMFNVLNNVDSVPKRPVFASRRFVVCVWGQRSSDQNDHWREEVPQWDMFPGRTRLPLIGHSIELIWTRKSKSNTSTPKTNSQTS